MTYSHENISNQWFKMSLCEQMGNIGSEVFRALSFLEREDKVSLENSRLRVLGLLEMSLQDPRWIHGPKLREIARLHEVLVDSLFDQGIYKVTPEEWQDYFLPFAIKARRKGDKN